MVKALYPGSFDPVHKGHVDIATRASKIFDLLIVAVYESPPTKRLTFSTEERVEMFRESVKHVDNIEVRPFTGLAPDVARNAGAEFIVRGLRAGFFFCTTANTFRFEVRLIYYALLHRDEGEHRWT